MMFEMDIVYTITLHCLKLNDLNTITIMDLCETGSIEEGLIVNKITALSIVSAIKTKQIAKM